MFCNVPMDMVHVYTRYHGHYYYQAGIGDKLPKAIDVPLVMVVMGDVCSKYHNIILVHNCALFPEAIYLLFMNIKVMVVVGHI